MRKKAKSKSVLKLNKQLMLVSVKYIAKKIAAEKEKNGGRVPWGFAARLLKEGKETFPNMSMRTVNNYIKRIENPMTTIGPILVNKSSGTNITAVSSLTEDDDLLSNKSNTQSDYEITSNSETTATSGSNGSTDSESEAEVESIRLGGRPRGSTAAYSLELRKRIEAATRESVSLLSDLQREMKRQGRRLSKGVIEDTISQCAARHNLPPSVELKTGTIKQRLKRQSTKGTPGQSSPMESIEPYIVSIIIQLSNMRIPITVSQGLQLCNSIIKGTKYKEVVNQFKSKTCRSVTAELGRGYWRGFLKRNKHLISSKKGVKFDTKRAEWCTYLNMKEMYDEVYTSLVNCGLAVKHDTPMWRNNEGEVVNEEDAVGCQSEFELIHPSWLVFVDEVGSNTSQVKDGNVGGEKYLCTKQGRPQQRAATKDTHFTVLGFTAATGDPVMCTIIFAAKTMQEQWRLGFDPFAEWVGEENDIHLNIGEGKVYPMGPNCSFNGKNVPCFCCCSESGSITGTLLVQMLQAIDSCQVFDRTTGLSPFLLLDGHGSRFELEFLEYINTAEHKWNCCIGLPYGTSYWQVGDSSEQNGCFKMALTKVKQQLVMQKNDSGLEYTINREDIVGLVQKAWKSSFARVETNRQAISKRGWGPRALNYNALCHPEVLTTKPGFKNNTDATTLETTITPDELNLSEGLAGTLVDKIFVYKSKEADNTGINAVERMRKRKATAEQHIQSHDKRITAGLLAAAGRFQLGEDIRNFIQERANEKEQQQYEKHLQKKNEYDELLAKVQQVRGLNLPPDKWTQAQLKIMLRWLKRDGDEKIPSRKQDQLTRYHETCHREDLPAPEIPLALQHIHEHHPPLEEPSPIVDDLLIEDDDERDRQELARIMAGRFQNEEMFDDAATVVPMEV
jgi:hypothetical protein